MNSFYTFTIAILLSISCYSFGDALTKIDNVIYFLDVTIDDRVLVTGSTTKTTFTPNAVNGPHTTNWIKLVDSEGNIEDRYSYRHTTNMYRLMKPVLPKFLSRRLSHKLQIDLYPKASYDLKSRGHPDGRTSPQILHKSECATANQSWNQEDAYQIINRDKRTITLLTSNTSNYGFTNCSSNYKENDSLNHVGVVFETFDLNGKLLSVNKLEYPDRLHIEGFKNIGDTALFIYAFSKTEDAPINLIGLHTDLNGEIIEEICFDIPINLIGLHTDFNGDVLDEIFFNIPNSKRTPTCIPIHKSDSKAHLFTMSNYSPKNKAWETFLYSCKSDGTLEWQSKVGIDKKNSIGNHLHALPNGNYLLSGTFMFSSPQSKWLLRGIFLQTISPKGTIIATKPYTGKNSFGYKTVTHVKEDGTILLSGDIYDDFWLVTFSEDMTLQKGVPLLGDDNWMNGIAWTYDNNESKKVPRVYWWDKYIKD